MRLEPSPKRYIDTNLTSSVSNAFNALQMIEISFHELNKFEARSSWVTEGKYDCIVAGSPGELMDLSPTPTSRVCWKSLQEKYINSGKHDLHLNTVIMSSSHFKLCFYAYMCNLINLQGFYLFLFFLSSQDY